MQNNKGIVFPFFICFVVFVFGNFTWGEHFFKFGDMDNTHGTVVEVFLNFTSWSGEKDIARGFGEQRELAFEAVPGGRKE